MPAIRVISSLQGVEVFCKGKSGVFEGSTIRCKCCKREFAPSAFESHSGSSFRRPWRSIKDKYGKSIHQYKEEEMMKDYDKHRTSDSSDTEKVPLQRIRKDKKRVFSKVGIIPKISEI